MIRVAIVYRLSCFGCRFFMDLSLWANLEVRNLPQQLCVLPSSSVGGFWGAFSL
jgi:hypothetical protein